MAGGADDLGPYATKADKKAAEKMINQLRGQFRTLKVQFEETDGQISVATELKTELHQTRLSDNFAECKAIMKDVIKKVNELDALNEPEDSPTMTEYISWEGQFAQLSTRVKDAEKVIGKAMAEKLAQQPAPVMAVAQGPRPGLPKANDLLRPKELQLDDKPSILRLWKREFQDYFESYGMGQSPVRVQHSYFLHSVSQRLRTKLRHMILDVTPVLAVAQNPGEDEPDSCYKFLDEIFQHEHPMVRRRQDFFSYMQQPGQKTSDYMDKLRELFDEAELQQFRAEDLLTYKAIQGCTVEPTRTKFVREEEPTFKKLEKIAHTIEAGENALLGQSSQTSTAVAYKAERQLPKYQKAVAQNIPGADCGRCSGRDRSNHNLSTCKYKEAICHKCGEKGHISNAPFCKQGRNRESGSPKEEEAVVHTKSVQMLHQ